MLRLSGRYYRTVPLTDPGYVCESLELDERRTALVAMHCWNIGCEGGPAIDSNFWVGMGFPVVHREAERIMVELIRPAMDAARSVGMLVCHVESETIRASRSAGSQEVPSSDKVSVPSGWREQIAWRSHGRDYGRRSPLARMDRAEVVAPREGEPFVFTAEELHSALQEKGIGTLVYCGFATDMCVLRAPGGVESMAPRDYRILLLRDATIGVECPDTFIDRIATRWGIRYFETHFGDTITTTDLIQACRGA